MIEYAGSGGRLRGQIEQLSNLSIKIGKVQQMRLCVKTLNLVALFESFVDLSVGGKYGTKDSGGGYRYDGLFRVEKAEMRETGRRKLTNGNVYAPADPIVTSSEQTYLNLNIFCTMRLLKPK